MAFFRRLSVLFAVGLLLVTVGSSFASGSVTRQIDVAAHAPTTRHAMPYPLPAPVAEPGPCTVLPPGPPSPPPPPPTVPTVSIPAVVRPGPRSVSLTAVEGKGIWLTIFPGQKLNAEQVVAMATRAGLQTLYVRTGGTSTGFYGGTFLRRLVAVAHRRHIFVVAWDFPTLSNPAADAARAAAAFSYGVDGFSPDIEEAPEGTYLSARRVRYYLSLVRIDAGDRPVIATVPRPVSLHPVGYPYAAEAPFVDAFAPMVYWSCSEPGAAVATALAVLRPLRPVVPIGEDYDMGSEGGPVGLPSGAQVWRFIDVARRDGAIGVSLYDFESGGPAQLAALTDYPWGAL